VPPWQPPAEPDNVIGTFVIIRQGTAGGILPPLATKESDEAAVIPRRVFAVLTTLLVVLTIAAAAVMAVHVLLSALGDADGAKIARWIGAACLAALLIDVIALAGALGWQAMQSSDNSVEER
jgi:hypothetical protein